MLEKIIRTAPLKNEELLRWLKSAGENAYNPMSGYSVSVLIRANIPGRRQNDVWFAGVNMENVSQRISGHAEEGAIALMVATLGPKAEIKELVSLGKPAQIDPDNAPFVTCCGKCRQQIINFTAQDVPMRSFNIHGDLFETTSAEFLPDKFSYRNFADVETLVDPDQPQDYGIEPTEILSNKIVRPSSELSDRETLFKWVSQIYTVDYNSHVTHVAALHLDNGMTVVGAGIEEAAYVAIHPIQAALSSAVTLFGEDFGVNGITSYSRGRDSESLSGDNFQPLTLDGLQLLAEFCDIKRCRMTLFNANGQSVTGLTVDNLTSIPVSYDKKSYSSEEIKKRCSAAQIS